MTVYQFSYKRHGRPTGWPTLDCRRLPNRMSVAEARRLPRFQAMVQEGVLMLQHFGKLAVGCMYGRHRSVAVAEEIVRTMTGATMHRADTKGVLR